MTDTPFQPLEDAPAPPPPPPPPADNASAAPAETAAAQPVLDVPVDVQVVLGHSRMTVDKVMKLGRGAVVEIERRVGEAVEVCVNDHLVARGEVVIVDGDKLGVALTEVVGAPSA